MSRLPRISSDEMNDILRTQGFVSVRQKGSHLIFRHPDDPTRGTTVQQGKKVLPIGVVLCILRQARLDREVLS